MFKPGDKVVAGVSGGPDSVFMLHALAGLRDKLKIRVIACHLDHGLRGADSREDARFVKKLADRLGVRHTQKKLARIRPSGKLSLEEAFRKERYDFFCRTCRRFRARVIATAHTLDDQAETVLMRIVKGATLKGLVGILPVRYRGSLKIVRPVIGIEKSDIVSYLQSREYDPTNGSISNGDIYRTGP